MKTLLIDYYKPSVEIRRYEEPWMRYYPRKITFWDFLNLNFFKQLDFLCQQWLVNRELIEQKTISSNTIAYTKCEIKLDNIVRQIFEQSDLITEIYNDRPKYLILGRKYMRALEIEANHKFSFAFPSNYTAPLAGQLGIERIFAGMRVVCIPWMDGAIVLPELE